MSIIEYTRQFELWERFRALKKSTSIHVLPLSKKARVSHGTLRHACTSIVASLKMREENLEA